jgi:DNA-directed RNA polymerase specialized sigma24 family protein
LLIAKEMQYEEQFERCKNLQKQMDIGKVKSSIEINRLEKEWAKLADISQELDDIRSLPNAAHAAFMELSETAYQAIMVHRYLNGLTWQEIADVMGLSERWVRELAKTAEKELEEKILPLCSAFEDDMM